MTVSPIMEVDNYPQMKGNDPIGGSHFSLNHDYLVGGFNPPEKYWSNWKSSPNRGGHKKCLKPPPSSGRKGKPSSKSHLENSRWTSPFDRLSKELRWKCDRDSLAPARAIHHRALMVEEIWGAMQLRVIVDLPFFTRFGIHSRSFRRL